MATMERRTQELGFTILELIVSMSLLSIVLAGFFGAILTTQRMYTDQLAIARGEEAIRAAEFAIGVVLRAAGADPLRTGTPGLDPDPLGHGRFDNVRAISDFNPPDGDTDDLLEDVLIWVNSDTLLFRWSAAGEGQAMAYPVNQVGFRYFANDGTELTGAAGATRILFTIEVPRDPHSQSVQRRESWVYLRNR